MILETGVKILSVESPLLRSWIEEFTLDVAHLFNSLPTSIVC